jgi:hypothetical protein
MRLSPCGSLAVAALVTAVGLRDAPAQVARPPQLRATVDLRIDKALPDASRSAALLVGSSGEMIVAQLQSVGAIRGFDSAGRAMSWSIPTGVGRDSDIRWVTRMGWSGSTLWVADPGFNQLALIDRNGKITKSLEYPSWVRPAWADRRKFPVFADVEPFALYSDGTWLVRPSRERSLVSTPDYDKSVGYLMRIAENGSVLKVIARIPRDERRIDVRFNNSSLPAIYPPLTLWDVAADGAHIVVVATSLSGPDSATYRVTALGAQGDTVFNRRFPFTPAPMSKQSVDSVRARLNRSLGARSGPDLSESMVKQLPWAYPPIEQVIVGRDQTTWIGLRATSSDRTWIALDAAGTPSGLVTLPRDFLLRAADREHVWGFERDGDRVVALVRYKVLPATPHR